MTLSKLSPKQLAYLGAACENGWLLESFDNGIMTIYCNWPTGIEKARIDANGNDAP